MQEEAEFHRIPFQRGFVWTQQPQRDEAGAQICLVRHKLTDTVLLLGQIKLWKLAPDFPMSVGEPFPQALQWLHSAETCLIILTFSWKDLPHPQPQIHGFIIK